MEGSPVSFRLDKEIKELAMKIAERQGMNLSNWLRHLVMKELAELSFLPEENKKALGIRGVKKID